MHREVLPQSIDSDTDRYSGLLQMRVNTALDEVRSADRKTFKSKLAAYSDRCEDLLAYIAAALVNPRLTQAQRENLLKRRALTLPDMIKQKKRFAYWRLYRARAGIKLKDWASQHPKSIKRMQYLVASGLGAFIAAGLRAAFVGTAVGTSAALAGIAAFTASWVLGQHMKGWKDTKVEDAEKGLEAAYAAYTEENRNESVARIARALAKKRREELRRTMRRLGIRMFVGGTVGGVLGALLADAIPGARAGTLHKSDGTFVDVRLTEGNIYQYISNRGGFFAVQNDDGTYNIFYFDRTRNTVELAIGGARTLREMSDIGALELSPSDVEKLSRADQATIWYASSPTVRDVLAYTNAASEEEMKNLYLLQPPLGDKDLPASYWLEVLADMRALGPGKFFIGDRPATNAEISTLYRVLFSRIEIDTRIDGESWKDPTTGAEIRTRATFRIEENEDGELRPIAREDPTFRNLPPWAQASVRAHEMGHLLHSILNIEVTFNNLPAAEREKIMSELFVFYQKLTEMDARGNALGYKGWTEEMRQLVFMGRTVTDKELFAEFIGKMMTHPDEVRAHCPRFYELMKKLINEHPELSKVAVVK